MERRILTYFLPGTAVRVEVSRWLKAKGAAHAVSSIQNIRTHEKPENSNKNRINSQTRQKVLHIEESTSAPNPRMQKRHEESIVEDEMNRIDGPQMERLRIAATVADIASVVIPALIGISIANHISAPDFIANSAGACALLAAKVPANAVAKFATTLFAQNVISDNSLH